MTERRGARLAAAAGVAVAARLAAAAGVAVLVAAPTASAGDLTAQARLQGVFAMTGRITEAVNVGREHVGERVRRTWAFASTCPAGPCPTVTLRRARGGGQVDQLVLRRRAAGRYDGTTTFIAPMRCRGRRYAKGEAVPFTITVRVTAAALVDGQVTATRIRASYRNRRRIGLTRCVAARAHEAARYIGSRVPPVGGSTRSVPSTASTAVS